MALPEGDFSLCMDLIPQKVQGDATITALATLAQNLEARFPARPHSPPSVPSEVPARLPPRRLSAGPPLPMHA